MKAGFGVNKSKNKAKKDKKKLKKTLAAGEVDADVAMAETVEPVVRGVAGGGAKCAARTGG